MKNKKNADKNKNDNVQISGDHYELKNVCCMFDEIDAERAVKNADLELKEILYDSYRHTFILYKCRKCGAFVLYCFEEIAMFDWDNCDCFDCWYPVNDAEEARELAKKYWHTHYIGRRGHIEGYYVELEREKEGFMYINSEDIEKFRATR